MSNDLFSKINRDVPKRDENIFTEPEPPQKIETLPQESNSIENEPVTKEPRIEVHHDGRKVRFKVTNKEYVEKICSANKNLDWNTFIDGIVSVARENKLLETQAIELGREEYIRRKNIKTRKRVETMYKKYS